ncbi:MAG: LysR substrate-binding domain-containing protein, partial [Hyphococcus sp.]
EEVGADPSVVSRRISSLEARLGVRLLQRSTRRSSPTEAGERYYAGLRRLVDEQMALENDVAGLVDTPTGRLRIAAPVDFGARFVTPVIADLQARFPDLVVDLVLGSAFADLIESNIDVAIRIGALPDSSLIAKRIGVVPRIIVASEGFVKANGAPARPAELVRYPFIFYGGGQRELTIELRKSGKTEKVTVYGSVTVNSVTAIRALVTAGRGLHLGPVWAFEDGLADTSVVRVLPRYEPEAFPLHALYPASSFVPAKTRMFIDAFAQAMRASTAVRTG